MRRVLHQLTHSVDPVLFCQEALDFNPDPWQATLLRTTRRRIIVNVARQTGKSHTAAAKAVHKAVYTPKSLTVIVAPALAQSKELRRKVEDHMRKLKEITAKTVTDNQREMEFSNGSRIIVVAADEATIRGYTPDLIIEDEAAQVADPIYNALEPSLLVSRGQYILLSTPKGLKGHFADIWQNGTSWEKYEVTSWQNPRVAPGTLEALKAEKTAMGQLWWFQQEYECSFIAAAQGLVYPFDPKKNACPRIPTADHRGWQYVLGIDYGFNDSTAFTVIGWQQDDPTLYVIESLAKREMLATEAAELAHHFAKKYPFARMVGDTSGFGKGYVEEARRRFRLPIEAAEKNNKRGYIELMASDLRAGLIKVFPGNEGLIQEWQTLPWDEDREKPMDGYVDHQADATLYAWRAACHYLEEIRKPGPKKGTPEHDEAEAAAMFQAHIDKIARAKDDWWDEKDAEWDEPQQVTETSFLQ